MLAPCYTHEKPARHHLRNNSVIVSLANEVKLRDFGSVVKSIDFREGDSVVIITREHQHDEVVPKECLSKDRLPGYVGMIGSKEKIAATFSHLRQQGISEQLLARIRAPIGLDIGARSPAEIALSIMAEIIAQRYGKMAQQSETKFRKKEVVTSS
jgi:xanthine dehydrogenase accessory factor